MKVTKPILVLACAVSCSGVANASWLDGSPYIAGGMSYTIYDGLDDVASDGDTVDYQRISKNAFGFMGTAGWAFHGGYSLEISYADFGEFEITESVDMGAGTLDTKVTGSFTGKSIGMRYDWLQSESMNVYARLGVMRWEAAWDSDMVYAEPGLKQTSSLASDTDGSDFYAGVGGQYEIMRNLFAYAEAYYLDANFDKDGFSAKERVYAVFGGVMYRFGDIARPSGTTDKRTLEVTACDPKYKDISGVMCE